MKIRIFNPELIHRRGFNGFYRHFLSALVSEYGARPTEMPRPLPRLLKPREHESCWVDWDGKLLFFDMSDHVQLFDLDALDRCDLYFKANLHRKLAMRILEDAQQGADFKKLKPFLFFSEGLREFIRDARLRKAFFRDNPQYDICFVMGVYENLVRDGGRSPFAHPDEPITPARYHFWIRWHVMKAMQKVGISGYYRLTSRANRSLEDGVNVCSNLSRRKFSDRMTRGRLTAVCTLPHALFPWKASESFALGRPLLIERAPLTETPEMFRPIAGTHYLELLPSSSDFVVQADLDDSRSHRILSRISLEEMHERVLWLRDLMQDRERLAAMGEACQLFAARAYDPKTVADYIRECVEDRSE